MANLRACVLALVVLAASGTQVTPMEKVITLLKGLSAKVAADGEKDAAAYDKFACFCKEQADEKLYSIEKSTAKLASLKAQIKELDSAIAQLNSEISSLSKKMSTLESDIKKITSIRDKEHAEYKLKAKDMNEAIDACDRAIKALKDSKSSMKDAKLDLAQRTAKRAVALLTKLGAAPKEMSGQVSKFEYQSNDIIATLESLLDTFKAMKKDLDVEEFDINAAYDSKKLGLANERTFAEKEKGEKETIVESKTEELEAAKNDRDEEKKDMDADQAFLDELTNECQEKATLYDQRSSTRSGELTAINEATAELEKGAVPNFSANKKLVGLQKKAAVVQKAAISPVSFVQINNVQSRQEVVVQKVLDSLHGAAGRTGSSALAAVAMRVSMAEDHFVKVRALIKDLMAKLKADAKSEATQKSYCDKNMKKTITDRDEANANIEVANAKITTLTAKKEALKADISDLTSDIAGLKKSLLEATELRNDDKAEHTKTLGMSKEGIASVKLALSILQNFYKKALFAQTGKYTPPKSDREGNTVGDLAPEYNEGKYHGSQNESKGIIGILEVILSDFERTQKVTNKDEKESEAAFEQLEKETNDDIKEKEVSRKKKEGELSDTKSDIIDQQQALKDATGIHESSLKTLEDLTAMCVKGEETWEERKKKREEEIAALKEAMQILDDWQK